MKFAEDLFPKGTFSKQQTGGAYINENLSKNLDILAKKIADDMHFLLLITGHDNVGNGKTTLLTQVGTYLTWKINQLHKTNNTFESNNLVFSGKELIQKSLELPKFSIIGLDEGDELTTHGMKELARKLKTYFRKCRQLNQILVLILPSFFELPKFYALARSTCLLDVKFMGEFDRGYFSFYGSKSKKLLYLKGKKEWDYECVRPDFEGRFFGSYCFFPNLKENMEKYKKVKFEDLRDEEEEKTPEEIERIIKVALFNQIYSRLKDKISVKDLIMAFGIRQTTGYEWIKEYRTTPSLFPFRNPREYNKITNIVSDDDEEERDKEAEKKRGETIN